MAPRWILLAISLGCSACTTETGILPMGPDTFTLSVMKAPLMGGADAAEAQALTEANHYCLSHGRQFFPVHSGKHYEGMTAIYGPVEYSVTFRCLRAGRSILRPPTLEPAPRGLESERELP